MVPKKDTFFFKTKTLRIPTWKSLMLIVAVLVTFPFAAWPLLRNCITNYLYKTDPAEADSVVVLENWGGNIDLFEGAAKEFSFVRGRVLCSVIYEDSYLNQRKRTAYVLNAWASGIDTTKLKLIPVLKAHPKTLHTARAVIDTLQNHKWSTMTLFTFDLHTARSAECYRKIATPLGIEVRVVGLSDEGIDSSNWFRTSSGLASGFSETIKRLYYDIFVL